MGNIKQEIQANTWIASRVVLKEIEAKTRNFIHEITEGDLLLFEIITEEQHVKIYSGGRIEGLSKPYGINNHFTPILSKFVGDLKSCLS
jgi:hypothetical protein